MRRSLPILLWFWLATSTVFAHDPPPVAGQAPPVCTVAAPLDINSATAEQLDTLPGIGPAIAARIVTYRDERGPFTKIEQLNSVKGIGERTLEKIRPCLTLR